MQMNVVGGEKAQVRPRISGLPGSNTLESMGKTRHAVRQEVTRTPQENIQERILQRQKDSYVKTPEQDVPKTHQKKTQQVLNHFVSQAGGDTFAKKTQEKDTQKARDAEYAAEEGKASGQPESNVPLDNASRIGLMYQQATRQKSKQEGKLSGDLRGHDSGQNQQGQLKKFLGNLREYVKLEYKQYTKSDISTYSRRNLREVLSALGENVKAFDNKAVQDRTDRNNRIQGPKGYNKHFATKAGKNLKLFNEDPMNDPNYEKFEMIA